MEVGIIEDLTRGRLLVTGATGYVGGRLVPRLLDENKHVRVFTRDISRLQGRSWIDQVELSEGDINDPASLVAALTGVDIAYYMIPEGRGCPGASGDRTTAAEDFARAARQSGVQRIVHLGERSALDEGSSTKTASSIGNELRKAGLPITEFLTSLIVGSGSVFFELIRYLTERVPIVLLPNWAFAKVQPIGIGDVLDYLVSTLDVPQSQDKIIEIAGADALTFSEMLAICADLRGLRQWQFRIPPVPATLSANWIHWTTPVPKDVACPIVMALQNASIMQSNLARSIFPSIRPTGFETAVGLAFERFDVGHVETSWSDALSTNSAAASAMESIDKEAPLTQRREKSVSAPPEEVYRVIALLGGRTGWLYFNWAWRLRGIMDRLSGGVGLQRGRRTPETLRVGDAVDFWRVEALEPNRLLRFRAEMKLPGKAWLQFAIEPLDNRMTEIHQVALFKPEGLLGYLYWYLLYPIHKIIFSGMVKEISRRAELAAQTTPQGKPSAGGR